MRRGVERGIAIGEMFTSAKQATTALYSMKVKISGWRSAKQTVRSVVPVARSHFVVQEVIDKTCMTVGHIQNLVRVTHKDAQGIIFRAYL